MQWQAALLLAVVIILYLLGHYFPYNGMLGMFVLLVCLVIVYFGGVALMNSWPGKAEGYTKSESNLDQSICTGTTQGNMQENNHTCGANKKLLPIMEPEFNMREVAKQMILLEDHLSNPGKRCADCIKKHSLTIEGLAEEGAALDKKGTCRDECIQVSKKMREIEKELLGGKDPSEVAQDIRKLRKPLMTKYFDFVKEENNNTDLG